MLLIDAPCSGTGSLAREPDQKWKLTAQEISRYQTTQSELLEEVARQAKPGALVVYATCSVMPEEDEVVVEGFLAKHPDFTLEPVSEVLGAERAALAAEGPYLRALPPRVPGGGFFAARLRKTGQG
ncbi:hypothetical protein ACLESO_42100 [Pyxidicoccus sp. 3LG]